MNAKHRLLLAALFVTTLSGAAPSASAVSISFSICSKPNDEMWDLFGETYQHYDNSYKIIIKAGVAGPGAPIDEPAPADLAIERVVLEAGPNAADALLQLGGSDLIFDNTVFPAPAGFTTNTMGGFVFQVDFDTPFVVGNSEAQFEFDAPIVSSRLDLFDSSLIVSSAELSTGQIVPVAIMEVVPEPATLAMASIAALGWAAAGLQKQRSRSRRSRDRLPRRAD